MSSQEKYAELIYKRLSSTVSGLKFNDLMEYTIDSHTGVRIDTLYKNIMEETFGAAVEVYAEEISDSKYRIKFTINNSSYWIISKGYHTKDDIIENILLFVVDPLVKVLAGCDRFAI